MAFLNMQWHDEITKEIYLHNIFWSFSRTFSIELNIENVGNPFLKMEKRILSFHKAEIKVDSSRTKYTDEYIESSYTYNTVAASVQDSHGGQQNKTITLTPYSEKYTFRISRKTSRIGLMMVGWGGNNGSTLTAALLAHKNNIKWETKTGRETPNYLGSMLMSSTMKVGYDQEGRHIYAPFCSVLPVLDPKTLAIGGWDISGLNLADAMDRAEVLEPDLKRQLRDELKEMKPLKSVYDMDFLAANQELRADNIIDSKDKSKQLEIIRENIRNFKQVNKVDKVIIVWTASTERLSTIIKGVNDTWDSLSESIKASHKEVSPSTIFAVASILEGCIFINGSPQNTFVPGVIELAIKHNVPIAGDDFKSGQTKIKSCITDFLVKAGIKPVSIASYNHLGNNDGHNLSEAKQHNSKQISKTNVIDDTISSNSLFYGAGAPDHVVVIKYLPAVGDSKRALDEYESEIFMGGRSTISIHNRCEDSLLACPLIIDLVLLGDLLSRIEIKKDDGEFTTMNPVLSYMSYLLKAPLVPKGAPVINAFFSQRLALENLFRAVLGLPPNSELDLRNHL